jgi:hypothetical protein
MEAALVHQDVRELITVTDRLSRRAHAAHQEREAEVFASLRTSLLRLDRWLGAQIPPARASVLGALDLFYLRVCDAVARAPLELRSASTALIDGAKRLHDEAARPILLVAKLPEFLRVSVLPAPMWRDSEASAHP